MAILGIDKSLVERLMVNYHILLSEYYMNIFDYDKKDEAVDYNLEKYRELTLNDREMLSLARYLCFYQRRKEAKWEIETRIDKIDVNEDLLFYYLNLELFSANVMGKELFVTAINNALVLNKKRVCTFFNSRDKGGASFQLLDDNKLMGIYCSFCR